MVTQNNEVFKSSGNFFTLPQKNFCEYNGLMGQTIQFILKEQLLKRDLWKQFVQQYKESDADFDGGWRGEYWGKMMMGACYLFETTANNELYFVLEETVRDMLTAQRNDGRISTYAESHELSGWDVWCRKYVLIGMEYFLPLCRDNELSIQIINSLCLQMDAIILKVGENKKSICEATNSYRGLNASSILEAVVLLYRITDRSDYLDFARYIVKCGGTSIFDIFEAALADELLPYQYPVTKAYEMISCFEGLIELYRAIGDENCKKAALQFVDRILETDFTIIGSCGCSHEFLDHSTNRQANKNTGPLMQETCVTISIMKILAQATLLTGDSKYVDAFETAFYNAYLGSLNTKQITQPMLLTHDPKLHLEPLPFDSYSPLTSGFRGREVGGFQIMKGHYFYGCCACIGATGCGLVQNMQLLTHKNTLVINMYNNAIIHTVTPSGLPLTLCMDTKYPSTGEVTITLQLNHAEQFSLWLRNPSWSVDTLVSINDIPACPEKGYIRLEKQWANGDQITISFDMKLQRLLPVLYEKDILRKMKWEYDYMIPVYDKPDASMKNHIAFQYGPLILATQQQLGWNPDIPIELLDVEDEQNELQVLPPSDDKIVSILLKCNNTSLTLTDYASAGKLWGEQDKIAAWIPIK